VEALDTAILSVYARIGESNRPAVGVVYVDRRKNGYGQWRSTTFVEAETGIKSKESKKRDRTGCG
jgi:hypothetical protein